MAPQEFQLEALPRNSRRELEFEFSSGDTALHFPLLLLRGMHAGPVLAASAGMHGDEYEGIRAILDTYAALEPEQMSGNFLAVPVLSVPACQAGTRNSPLDAANLARAFPGRADGAPTQVIAWQFDQCVLRHADLYVDLHSAGIRCAMPTLTGYDACDPRSREAATALGAPVL